VNTKADDTATNHYSEIDKISPRASNWSTWPEDLRNTSTAQTYVNVGGESVSSFAIPTPPPPPIVGPNASPSKPKSNYDLAQSMNELSLNSNSGANVTKKLDPNFLIELEKHLGEKEATKNTNANDRENQETGAICANYLHYSSLDKRQNSTPTQQFSEMEDVVRPSLVIPTLKPPPQGKPKSPVATIDHRTPSSLMLPSKVQNSWQPKSINVQRPRLQNDQRVSESATDAIVNQIWQQTQTLSQQNACPSDPIASRHTLLPLAQESVNLLQETASHVSDITSSQDQSRSSNVTKTSTLIQAHVCPLSSQNYPQNITNISQGNLLQETTNSCHVVSSSTNEARHGPCNVAKAAFNQIQTSLSNSQSYPQNSLSIGQNTFTSPQIATSNIVFNGTNESQYSAVNILKMNQNYPHNASSVNFTPLQNTNLISSSSSLGQNYSQSPMSTLNQTQNIPISNINNTHGITHIQNDLQQSQHMKPTTVLSEQVYAELKQTVRLIIT
jgi:hypothetical protein